MYEVTFGVAPPAAMWDEGRPAAAPAARSNGAAAAAAAAAPNAPQQEQVAESSAAALRPPASGATPAAAGLTAVLPPRCPPPPRAVTKVGAGRLLSTVSALCGEFVTTSIARRTLWRKETTGTALLTDDDVPCVRSLSNLSEGGARGGAAAAQLPEQSAAARRRGERSDIPGQGDVITVYFELNGATPLLRNLNGLCCKLQFSMFC